VGDIEGAGVELGGAGEGVVAGGESAASPVLAVTFASGVTEGRATDPHPARSAAAAASETLLVDRNIEHILGGHALIDPMYLPFSSGCQP